MTHPVTRFLITQYRRVYNQIDYPLRKAFRLHRSGLRLPREATSDLFGHFPSEKKEAAESLAARLITEYHLENFAQDSAPVNFRENLFYLHMLETALERSEVVLPDALEAADIGPSHWFYVQGIYAGLLWWKNRTEARQVHLTGHEIDAFRIYQDLYSRYDHALAHMRGLHGLEYLSDGFEKQPGCFDMITMFFPFVFPGDHLEWGLPDPLFRPLELLHNAWDSLKPGGLLLVVNQGEAEHEAEGEMFNQLDIHPRAGYRQDPLLFSYDLDRYVWTAVRDA